MKRKPRRWAPEPLEPRELLSITPILSLISPQVHALATGSGSTFDPATGITTDPNSGGSGITTDVSAPRPNELARRRFTAKFSGTVKELPPRLFDQSRQFYLLAPGGSNQFLHGTLQLRYYTPALPALVTTGSLSMADRSTNSGGVILANLTGDPTDVDSRGRPTHFNLVLNGGGGSGGIYASSTGMGTVDIAYKGNRATVTVRASIFIQGVGNPLTIKA